LSWVGSVDHVCGEKGRVGAFQSNLLHSFCVLKNDRTPRKNPPHVHSVVLMDQDIVHRISAPSKTAPGPRYSLVWKLVFWPRDAPAAVSAAAAGGGGGGGGVSSSSDGGGGAGLMSDGAPEVWGLTRPEWGAPQRIGSAAAGGGRRPVTLPQ